MPVYAPINASLSRPLLSCLPSHGATSGRLRAWLRPGPEFDMGGRGLFERSEFRSPHLSGPGQRPPKGRARAPMVLGPFAETKGQRRAGAQPRKPLPLS